MKNVSGIISATIFCMLIWFDKKLSRFSKFDVMVTGGLTMKHRKDYRQPKQGWVGGNPRFGKSNGNHKGSRASSKLAWKKAV